MDNNVRIENFKSIKLLDFRCSRVNVFIGEPNSGKSNIIEALSMLSASAMANMQDVFRFKTLTDLFYDSDVSHDLTIELHAQQKTEVAQLTFDSEVNRFKYFWGTRNKDNADFNIEYSRTMQFDGRTDNESGFGGNNTLYYEYKRLKKFESNNNLLLQPPFGNNLPGVLASNPSLRKWVSEFLREKGYRLLLRPVENDISIAKETNDELYTYPYYTISETLQRVIFLYTAIEASGKNGNVLLLDEPEANTFPFYTKFIAERIALTEQNQFFVTTHNPYLLMNVIQKTPVKDLNICIIKMEDYQTKVYPLSIEQVEKVLEYDMDVFLNLDRILDI